MGRVNAIVMPGPGQSLDLQTFAMPDLEMNSALLRVELSEVCGTDVHLQAGRLEGVPYPIIPGHVSTRLSLVVSYAYRKRGLLDYPEKRKFMIALHFPINTIQRSGYIKNAVTLDIARKDHSYQLLAIMGR